MRLLMLFLVLVALAAVGCSGTSVDIKPTLGCLEACLKEPVPVVTAGGDTLWVVPWDAKEIVLKPADNKAELK